MLPAKHFLVLLKVTATGSSTSKVEVSRAAALTTADRRAVLAAVVTLLKTKNKRVIRYAKIQTKPVYRLFSSRLLSEEKKKNQRMAAAKTIYAEKL